MSARVVHFEVPYDDAERARNFYRDVFGWQIQSMPEMQYNLQLRHRVTIAIRDYLNSQGFYEIETPFMKPARTGCGVYLMIRARPIAPNTICRMPVSATQAIKAISAAARS